MKVFGLFQAVSDDARVGGAEKWEGALGVNSQRGAFFVESFCELRN